jgi:hypothetical protein
MGNLDKGLHAQLSSGLPSSSSKGDSITKKTKAELEDENAFLKVQLQDAKRQLALYKQHYRTNPLSSLIDQSHREITPKLMVLVPSEHTALPNARLSKTGYAKVEKSAVVMSKISTSSNDLRVYWQG